MNGQIYKPIIFSAPMVQAILEGRKTQTRRVVKQRGTPGEILWVKETFKFNPGGPIYDAAGVIMDSMDDELIYRADSPNLVTKWTPSIHMPRWASRITLGVTGIRMERLQDISDEDAMAEGLKRMTKDGVLDKYGIPDADGMPGTDDMGWPWTKWDASPVTAYKKLWEKIHGPGSWDKNPLVWVIEFESVKL